MLVVALVITAQLISAQDTASYRNSISVNTKTYLAALMGYKPVSYHQVTYIRSNGKRGLRLGLDVKYKGQNGRFDEYDDLVFDSFFDTRITTDTFKTSTLYANHKIKAAFTLRPGLSIDFGKRKLKQVLGADLLLGVIPVTTTMSYTATQFDSAGNLTSSEYRHIDAGSNVVYRWGIVPFYGLRYSFSPRLYTEILTGITAEGFEGKLRFIDQQGNSFTSGPRTNFQFYTSGFINNISVGFRF